MNTGMAFGTTLSSEVTLTVAQKAALDVGHTLTSCVNNWNSGNSIVVLAENLQERYGDLLLEYFQHNLIAQVGGPVNLTCVNDSNGPKTIVQMPKSKLPAQPLQVQPTNNSQTATSNKAAVKTDAVSMGTKKPPRPMNCWMIFRDSMHMTLKAENPQLTVQEISTRCSEIWGGLSDAGKGKWYAAAKSAKEEHLRLYPDYKYSPRKPGQKKKRQSRKAKHAVTAAAAAAAGTETFDFASVPNMTMLSFTTDDNFANAAVVGPTNVEDIFASNIAQYIDPATFIELEPQDLVLGDQLHDTESLRHDRLQAELDAELGTNTTFEMFGEEAFAFRAGADGNATLPSIYSDGY